MARRVFIDGAARVSLVDPDGMTRLMGASKAKAWRCVFQTCTMPGFDRGRDAPVERGAIAVWRIDPRARKPSFSARAFARFVNGIAQREIEVAGPPHPLTTGAGSAANAGSRAKP